MNHTIRRTVLAAATALALAFGISQAQPPTETQMRDNADTQQRMDDAGHHVRENQRKYFATLDRNTKGYLTNDDVSADPFLTQNWTKCDANHDGKLTIDEYMICTRENPPPPQR